MLVRHLDCILLTYTNVSYAYCLHFINIFYNVQLCELFCSYSTWVPLHYAIILSLSIQMVLVCRYLLSLLNNNISVKKKKKLSYSNCLGTFYFCVAVV